MPLKNVSQHGHPEALIMLQQQMLQPTPHLIVWVKQLPDPAIPIKIRTNIQTLHITPPTRYDLVATQVFSYLLDIKPDSGSTAMTWETYHLDALQQAVSNGIAVFYLRKEGNAYRPTFLALWRRVNGTVITAGDKYSTMLAKFIAGSVEEYLQNVGTI